MRLDSVLVTGAAGLIGRGTLWYLAREGVSATALVLADPGDLPAARVVVGDATDPEVVRDALRGVQGVIHLAARPSPTSGTAEQVFVGNTAATFTVLSEAGKAGIRRVAIASSINAVGLEYHPTASVVPAYLPLDESSPTRAGDPYSLSKWVDEIVMTRLRSTYHFDGVALRFPLVGGFGEVPELDSRLPAMVERLAAAPAQAAKSMWSYLETRDAGRAAALALHPRRPGAHRLFVAAPTTYMSVPTAQLLAEYWPGVPQGRSFEGWDAPLDLRPAQDLLGFGAEHLLPAPVVSSRSLS